MKPIIDVACGSKMFWFDKNNPNVEFCDNRVVPYHEYYPKRYIEIKPDTVCDFTALPFPDKSFKLVVFDPPHLTWAGSKSWTRLKYGCLDENWPVMIHDGFAECMRVLDDYGTLIFKWSEVQIPLKKVLDAIGHEPLFGHIAGDRAWKRGGRGEEAIKIPKKLREIQRLWAKWASEYGDVGTCVIGAGFEFDYEGQRYYMPPIGPWQGSCSWEASKDKVEELLKEEGGITA